MIVTVANDRQQPYRRMCPWACFSGERAWCYLLSVLTAFNAERTWCWVCKRCGQLHRLSEKSVVRSLTQDELLIFCACVCVCVFCGFAVLQHGCLHIMLKVEILEDFMCSVSEHCEGIF